MNVSKNDFPQNSTKLKGERGRRVPGLRGYGSGRKGRQFSHFRYRPEAGPERANVPLSASETTNDCFRQVKLKVLPSERRNALSVFFSANGGGARSGAAASDCESDDGEEGDYTVYECPGLAPVRSWYFATNGAQGAITRKGMLQQWLILQTSTTLYSCQQQFRNVALKFPGTYLQIYIFCLFFRLARWKCEIRSSKTIQPQKLESKHQQKKASPKISGIRTENNKTTFH